MSRSTLALTLALVTAVSGVFAPAALARDMSPSLGSAVETVAALEQILRGEVSQGSAVDRTAALEVELFGRAEEGSVLPRLERLKEYLLPGHPQGLALRLAAAETALLARVSARPLTERLAQVEIALAGAKAEGPFATRLNGVLGSLGLVTENVTPLEIPAGTQVKARLTQAVTSENPLPTDPVAYEVTEAVKVGGVVVIPRGVTGMAHVVSTRPAGILGRDAELQLDFCSVRAADGNLVYVTAAHSSYAPEHPDRSRASAIGAGAAGLVLLGPAGAAGSLLVKGHAVVLEAGTEVSLATARPVQVNVFAQ